MSGCSQCGYDWVACECDDGEYEDDYPCDCPNPDIDLVEGTSTCYECGARRYLSTEELEADAIDNDLYRTEEDEEVSLMFDVGDEVEKASGYKWPGVIVAVFPTLSGELRYVVECTAPQVAGALHIYSPKQLTHREQS